MKKVEISKILAATLAAVTMLLVIATPRAPSIVDLVPKRPVGMTSTDLSAFKVWLKARLAANFILESLPRATPNPKPITAMVTRMRVLAEVRQSAAPPVAPAVATPPCRPGCTKVTISCAGALTDKDGNPILNPDGTPAYDYPNMSFEDCSMSLPETYCDQLKISDGQQTGVGNLFGSPPANPSFSQAESYCALEHEATHATDDTCGTSECESEKNAYNVGDACLAQFEGSICGKNPNSLDCKKMQATLCSGQAASDLNACSAAGDHQAGQKFTTPHKCPCDNCQDNVQKELHDCLMQIPEAQDVLSQMMSDKDFQNEAQCHYCAEGCPTPKPAPTQTPIPTPSPIPTNTPPPTATPEPTIGKRPTLSRATDCSIEGHQLGRKR